MILNSPKVVKHFKFQIEILKIKLHLLSRKKLESQKVLTGWLQNPVEDWTLDDKIVEKVVQHRNYVYFG
jgi:hypothetical protein